MRFGIVSFILASALPILAAGHPQQQAHEPSQAPSRAQSNPSVKLLSGTWKMRSGGPSMTFLPDASFVTGKGDGGVGHGTYSLSGDVLVLTYHTEGAADTTGDVVLYNRVVLRDRMLFLFQTEQRSGDRVWKYANDPANLSTKPRKIVMTNPDGHKQIVDGGPTVYVR